MKRKRKEKKNSYSIVADKSKADVGMNGNRINSKLFRILNASLNIFYLGRHRFASQKKK